jgi:methionyl-tRNA formyltransferase|tara:strand:- start:1974 stop:2780 length:807 start_codon:yes stop_codon:yes gene_type:complete
MNISVLTNKDLASCIALNLLLPQLSDHRVSVFMSARVGPIRSQPKELSELAFYEQTLFNQIVFPVVDAIEYFENPQWLTFNRIASSVNRPIIELNQINDPVELETLASSEPDIILSIRYGVILRDEVLKIPKHGVLNLHSGLLPGYRGVMATFRAMLNGEKNIGMTLHSIDDSTIDTGKIFATRSLVVDYNRSYLWNVLGLYEEGCQMIAEAVSVISNKQSLKSYEQPDGGNYYSFPSTEEIANFLEQGYTLVNPADIVVLAKKFMGP